MSVWKNILYIKYVIVCKLSQLILQLKLVCNQKNFVNTSFVKHLFPTVFNFLLLFLNILKNETLHNFIKYGDVPPLRLDRYQT